MPFPTPLAIAIYLTIWWIVLFAVLPFGVRPIQEDTDAPKGADPGAPGTPRLAIKALATTVISALLFAALAAYVKLVG